MQNFKPYLEFVGYSIGSLQDVPESAQGIDWADFFEFCLRQGIAGLVFDGIERSGLTIPQKVLFEWIGTVESIKATNLMLNQRSEKISRFWSRQGYRTCILKGQANAMMYPKPQLRSPGDIDIWVDEPKYRKVNVEEIIQIARLKAPEGHYSLHHVTMPIYDGTSVEVHYRPVFLDNWWKDKKLQQYINKVKEAQFDNEVTLSDGVSKVNGLTDEFNAVFLLLHMWHHLLSTRNNLKQLTDYYYLLKRGFSNEQKKEIGRLFQGFGVLKYARGIMWIEQQVLGLPNSRLIVDSDEEVGMLLLNETFHYGENLKKRSKLETLFSRVTRNLHLFRYFPSGVLIAPVYLMWHSWWRLKMKLRLKFQ